MASPDQVVEGMVVPGATIDLLRSVIGDSDLSNEELAVILVSSTPLGTVWNVNRAAGSIWTSKAASYASLVDVSESGSSRKLSDLHKNALLMADTFISADERSGAALSKRSRTRPIVRPS